MGLAASRAATAAAFALQQGQEHSPSLAVTAAMELIRSLMVLSEAAAAASEQPSGEGSAGGAEQGALQGGRSAAISAAATSALSSRFSEEEIKQAFGALGAVGWVSRQTCRPQRPSPH